MDSFQIPVPVPNLFDPTLRLNMSKRQRKVAFKDEVDIDDKRQREEEEEKSKSVRSAYENSFVSENVRVSFLSTSVFARLFFRITI